MEVVSDEEIPAPADAGAPGDAEIEQPPVIEPARKRKIEQPAVNEQANKRPRLGPALFDVPVGVLEAILPSAGNLHSANPDVLALNAAYRDLNDAERRSSEALGFICRDVCVIQEHFKMLLKRDMCDARFEARKHFTDDVTDAQRTEAIMAAQQEVRQTPRDLDRRCREYFGDKLQEFVSFFVQKMTRKAGPDDYFAKIKRLSEPLVDALLGNLPYMPPDIRCDTEPRPCPRKFSPNGIWTLWAMAAFMAHNDTVLLMKKVMCESLQRDVDKCRKKCKTCERQVDFSTGGYRAWVLEQQALAQQKAEEDNWRIGSGIDSYHRMVIFELKR